MRGTLVALDVVQQPGPAPRFSRAPCAIQRMDPGIGAHNASRLMRWAFSEDDIAALRAREALY